MLSGNHLQTLAIIFLIFIITACGGGGGNPEIPSNSSSSSQASSAVPLQALDRVNTPYVVENYLDLLLFAKDMAASIVHGEYDTGLADGTYKDSCEGGKGSFEIKVANNGNLLVQQYSNCALSFTEDGITEKLLISGEESVSIVRRENTPSTASITWKNYSISSNGATAAVIDGSFIYEGLLGFNRNANYINVTSKIKINARISGDDQSIDAEGVEFVFDFPSIFDRYPSAGFGYIFEPQGIHVFAENTFVAKGSINIGDIKTNFDLDASNRRVTFSNFFTAKSYLDGTSNGFFIRWDENNDGLADANVFLSEKEYSVISDYISDQTTDIYFTRYPDQYGTPLPPGHSSEGIYDRLDLSVGASIEINVQELFTSKSGALLTYEIDNQSSLPDWEQLEAGHFKLMFPNSNGDETYTLNITAVDIYNNRSPTITVTIRMNDDLADTDNDGILDIDDPDIDNDGVANEFDAFPKDPTESADSDRDGIGDNTDPDLDNDGIANADDHFPKDANCHSADDGDEYGCYLRSATYAFNDGGSTVYFSQKIGWDGHADIMRFTKFDVTAGKFLAPTQPLEKGGYVYENSFNPIYNSVLVHDGVGQTLFLLNLNSFSNTFIKSVAEHNALPYFSEQGYFPVFVREHFTSNSWTEVYNHNGILVDSNETESLANPTYYLGSKFQKQMSVPFCKFSVSLNSSGQLVTTGDAAQGIDDICWGTNSTSQNQLYTFPPQTSTGPGTIYDREGNILKVVNGHQLKWLDNVLVYIDFGSYHDTGSYDLVIDDFIGGQVKRYKNEMNHLGNIYVVGEKIISFSSQANGNPARLIVFNEELTIEFDSSAK